jgi:hypothetical protein
VIAAGSGRAEARDPARRRTWVILAGGAGYRLGLIGAGAARRGSGKREVRRALCRGANPVRDRGGRVLLLIGPGNRMARGAEESRGGVGGRAMVECLGPGLL